MKLYIASIFYARSRSKGSQEESHAAAHAFCAWCREVRNVLVDLLLDPERSVADHARPGKLHGNGAGYAAVRAHQKIANRDFVASHISSSLISSSLTAITSSRETLPTSHNSRIIAAFLL
jgi:hypothetical protein